MNTPHSEQSPRVAEPLAVYYDNNCVLLEDNKPQTADGKKFFSSFKIFKLKGPIDANFLIDTLFPPEDKKYYEIDVFGYDGESAEVKFNFSNKTHMNLIEYLKQATQKLLQISKNGLHDWVPADKVTNQLVYGNSYKQLSLFTTDYSKNNNNDEEYPEIDEEGLVAELKNLAEQIKSQRKDLSDGDLDNLFYYAFRRRNMSVNIYDIKDEFFSQLNIVQFLSRSDSSDVSDISDESLGLDKIKELLCGFMASQLQGYIHCKSLPRIINDYKFGLAIVLWNLINTFYAIHKSYQVLKDKDARFREILLEKKSLFTGFLNNMEFWITSMLKTLENDLDESQYDRFQKQLVNFLTAAEGLLETIKVTAVEYDSEIKTLEDQEKDLSKKWWLSVAAVGTAAVFGAGYLAYKSYKNETITNNEKLIATGVGAAGVTALVTGHVAFKDLQRVIQRQTTMLNQLKVMHDKVLHWTRCGKDLQNWDQTKMDQHRDILTPQLNQIKLQSKAFEKVFEDNE